MTSPDRHGFFSNSRCKGDGGDDFIVNQTYGYSAAATNQTLISRPAAAYLYDTCTNSSLADQCMSGYVYNSTYYTSSVVSQVSESGLVTVVVSEWKYTRIWTRGLNSLNNELKLDQTKDNSIRPIVSHAATFPLPPLYWYTSHHRSKSVYTVVNDVAQSENNN